MKKMKIILIIFLVVLAAGLAGCGTTPSPPEMISLESPFYIITGESNVGGVMDFWEEMELIYGDLWVSLLGVYGVYTLVEGVETSIDEIREGNSILIIPPTSEGIQEFRDLEIEYPDLCPLSCDALESELDSYSSPLLYFSQDLQSGKIIGIIVADQVNALLAELLSAEDIPLDVPFCYENEQLQILE